MNTVSATYTLSETQFMHAARALWSYEAIGDRGNIIIAIICAAIGPALLLYGQPIGWAVLVISFFFLALTWARNVIWRRAYRKMEKYTAPIFANFSADHVSVQSAQGSSELPWSYFKSYAETPDYFFLIAPRRVLSIIPKTAFTTDEDMDTTRDYMTAHLRRKKMRWT